MRKRGPMNWPDIKVTIIVRVPEALPSDAMTSPNDDLSVARDALVHFAAPRRDPKCGPRLDRAIVSHSPLGLSTALYDGAFALAACCAGAGPCGPCSAAPGQHFAPARLPGGKPSSSLPLSPKPRLDRGRRGDTQGDHCGPRLRRDFPHGPTRPSARQSGSGHPEFSPRGE